VSTTPTPVPLNVGILVLDDNAQGSSAVKQILDSEGWRVRVVSDSQMLFGRAEEPGNGLSLIANVALTGIDGHAFRQSCASLPASLLQMEAASAFCISSRNKPAASNIVHLEAARLP